MADIVTLNCFGLMANYSDLQVIMSEINPIAFCFKRHTTDSFVLNKQHLIITFETPDCLAILTK